MRDEQEDACTVSVFLDGRYYDKELLVSAAELQVRRAKPVTVQKILRKGKLSELLASYIEPQEPLTLV
ncbi:MAG: hypothetical protein H6765_06310 [Candidatus Peribacteria bacterium]|nr:MAG: hypothetical protein H6765_06310 [Candidatus Peribacteria bacterium]